MRKLATIRTIKSISPIANADKIEVARIDGWQVVVEKNLYQPGDKVIYCEIDSWIPHAIAPYLSKGGVVNEYEGIPGNRLKPVRLRNTLSQGLVLPLTLLGNDANDFSEFDDVANLLNIVKYEPPISAHLSGIVRGSFPNHTPKTDQERVQNIPREIDVFNESGRVFEMTEKLEGSSMTVSYCCGDLEVCSRKLSLRDDDKNTFWKVAKSDGLLDILTQSKLNISLQGELIGEGVEGNIYKLKGHTFYLYDIYDIDAQQYYTSEQRQAFCAKYGIKHVPVIGYKKFGDTTIDELIDLADGPSVLLNNQMREGIVFKDITNGSVSFKVISNAYLLQG